jgi:hypothetical protein
MPQAQTDENARPEWLLYAIVIAAGLSWFLAAATFWTINEFGVGVLSAF